MKVLIDPRSGFCGGVRRVVKMAEEHMAQTGNPLVSLGDVIHNEVEISRLARMGLTGTSHEILNSTPNGTKQLLIRAHGEPPETYEKAKQLGIEIIDGTCPVVTRSQTIARTHYLNDEQVVIIGKPYHPETIGILGHCDNQAVIVYEHDDVYKLNPDKNTFILTQTTVSAEWFQERVNWVKAHCSQVEVQVENTLCRFVVGRDRDLKKFAQDVDVCIMVGGTKSSNTMILYRVCKDMNPRSYMVLTEQDVDFSWFQEEDTVGVTGSASTPLWLLEHVRNFIAAKANAEII